MQNQRKEKAAAQQRKRRRVLAWRQDVVFDIDEMFSPPSHTDLEEELQRQLSDEREEVERLVTESMTSVAS